jgi:hypothetical protein
MSFFSSLFSSSNTRQSSEAIAVGVGYADCSSPEEKVAWLHSSDGQNVLARRPRLKQLYDEGKLVQMVYNPQWSERLDMWLSGNKGGGGGTGVSASRIATLVPHAGIQYTQSLASISDEDRFKILCDGYTILPGVIPEAFTRAAIKFLNYQIGNLSNPNSDVTLLNDPTATLTSYHSQESVLMNLLYATPLAGIINSLLHSDHRTIQDVQRNITVKGCQVAIRFPEIGDTPSHRQLGGFQWHIGKSTCFSLMKLIYFIMCCCGFSIVRWYGQR